MLEGGVMSEANLATSRRVLDEAFNQGDLSVVNEVSAPDPVSHDPAMPDDLHGAEAIKQMINMYRSAFPDLKITVDDTVVQDDKVVLRWTSEGTHRGELMGLAPTGVHVSVTGMSIDRFVDGKIAESWSNWDTLGLMRQLGAAPMPGSLGEKVGIQLQHLTARRQRHKAGVA
jgi:steroid delta-isomerase-like uncharacterized protein